MREPRQTETEDDQMSSRRTTRTRRSGTALAALAALLALAAAGSQSAGAASPVHVSTGGATHVHGTSAQLNGVLVAPGIAASVFFKYGPTVAYGHQTKPLTIPPPSPPKSVKVGQLVTGILAGWHYTMCATFTNPTTSPPKVETICDTKDKSFSGGKASKLKFVVPRGKEERLFAIYGGTLELSGSLTGTGNANHALTLQATPFPYTDPFTTLGGTVVSSRTGSFIFRVAHITGDAQLRVLTVDPKPVYSPVLTVHVTPRITLHVRSAGRTGIYRLYGTVAPSRPGAGLAIQQLTPQKAGSKREGPAAHSVAATVLKRATKSLSRFSVIVKLSGTSHYRAYVKLPKGAIESGHSSNVLIKAPAAKGRTKRR